MHVRKKPTKLDGNDTTTLHTIPASCAILPPLTQIYFVCLLVVCRGLWKAVQWVVLGVHAGDCMQKLWSP